MAGRTVFCEKWHGQVEPRIRKTLERNKGKAHWFHGNPEDFCDAVYKKEAYLRVYEPTIMPMTSQDQWMKINLPPLLPPKDHK
ncbi:unnamed protein product [Prunus armeniaca]